MVNRAEVLMAVRDTIKDDRNWNKEFFAQDDQGQDCSVLSDDATSFCVLGALDKVVYSFYNTNLTNLYDKFLEYKRIIEQFVPQVNNKCSVVDFNDSDDTTHSDVIQVLNQAISSELEKQERNHVG